MNITKVRPPKEMLCQCCNSEYELTLEDALAMSDQIEITDSSDSMAGYKSKIRYPCPVCGDQHGFTPYELPKEWMRKLLDKARSNKPPMN